MVLALAALAAAAASFPTGFGFGAGYGAGVRVGYDVIYPKIAPFASKITDDIIRSIGNVWGGNGDNISKGPPDPLPFPPDNPAISDIPPTPDSGGRRAGADDLKDVITDVGDKLTDPFTRFEKVRFQNYKTAVEKLNTMAREMRTAGSRATQAMINAVNRQKDIVGQFRRVIKNWPRYYEWLKRFTQ